MGCEQAKGRLGAYLDGELSGAERRAVEVHLAECAGCQAELDADRAVVTELSDRTPLQVPDGLWNAVEGRLGSRATGPSHSRPVRARRRYAVAAGIVLAAAIGTAFLSQSDWGAGEAQASTINFDVLLDSISLDPDKALRKFLVLYDAREIRLSQVPKYASNLSYALPDSLPSDFRLVRVYGLRFGDSVGLAARYARGNEFLAVIVHPAVHEEDYGTHQDYSCVIGRHRGQKVSVGPWSMVHVTDPTTCHCVLSRLGDSPELGPILAAVAPLSVNGNGHHHHVGSGH